MGTIDAGVIPDDAQPPTPPQEGERPAFKISDQVEKFTGDYQLVGEVRAVFTNRRGDLRYVVEHTPGFLHIYSEKNLRARPALAEEGELCAGRGGHAMTEKPLNAEEIECFRQYLYDRLDASLSGKVRALCDMALATASRPAGEGEVEGLIIRLGWHSDHPVTGELVLRNPDGPEAAATLARQQEEIASLREQLAKATTTQTPEK